MPRVEQLVLLRPFGLTADEAELRAYRARRRAGAIAGAYVVSLSFRTITYKALCAADQLGAFYPDLREPSLEVPFAIFHQRFSTNTSPSWERAQPFRVLCHNGEINTIDGNVRAMRGREARLGLDGPALEEDGSDSALLDNALELLVRTGRDVRHAAAMLLPRAWQHDAELDEEARAFHRYHAGLVEPWDGPAAVVFTDGRVVGAALDRNGLRPLRIATAGGIVACASEAGAIPLPDAPGVRRERVGPGQLLRRRSRRRASSTTGRSSIGSRAGARIGAGSKSSDSVRSGQPVAPPEDDLTRRQLAAAATREDLTLLLRAERRRRTRAGLLDGRRHGAAPARRPGSATLLVPAPALRPGDEPGDRPPPRAIVDVAADADRPRGAAARGERDAGRLVELESFFLYPSAVAALRGTELSTALRPDETPPRRVRADRGGGDRPRRRQGTPRSSSSRTPAAAPPCRACSRSAPCSSASSRPAAGPHVSLVVVSDEPRDSHHVACLLGFGADAVCPRLALETTAALAAADRLGGDRPSPDAGAAPPSRRRRGRRAQGHGEDGHRRRRVVPRRPALRRARTGARGRRSLLHRRGVRARRDRFRRARAGAALAAGGRRSWRHRATSSTGRAASRTRRRRRWSSRCRRSRACAPPLRPYRGDCGVRALRGARRRARAAGAARPARGRRSRAARTARTRSSRPRRSCAASRAAACRTARSPRRRTRRSRSPSTGSVHARTAARAARIPPASATSATRGSSRSRRDASASHPSTLAFARRAADQGRPGLEARRGRPAPGPQGDGRDRSASAHPTGRRSDLAAAPPRHLLDRGSGAARLRPAPGEPAGCGLRQARRRGGRRARRRGRREGARGRRPRRRQRRRHRREPARIDQERGRAVGARARGDAADARRARACADASASASTAASRPDAMSSSPRCSAPTRSRSGPRS